MTNDCKTCPVSTGTHKPAEALQHISEPQTQQPDALRLLQEYRKTMPSEVLHLWANDACDAMFQQHARIAELEGQLDAIGAGGVEPLRKPAAQAVHQIAEPAAPVGKPIKDAIDALVMAAFTEGGCSEHRMSEARIQTELRKKELCTLLSTPQPCCRSHPHEEMTPMCELRTEIARLTNALARAEAAAPQAVQAAVSVAHRHEFTDGHRTLKQDVFSAIHDYAATKPEQDPDDPESWESWFEAAFDLLGTRVGLIFEEHAERSAPAHPAEGVPAAKNGRQVLVDSGALQMVLNALERDALEGKQVRAAMRLELMQSIANLPQPAAQGMDAQLVAFIEKVRDFKAQAVRVGSSDGHVRWDIEYGHYGAEVRAKTLPDAIAKAIAAQAKQGGVDHG